MSEFEIDSTKQHELVDITNEVNQAVRGSGIKSGLCNVYTAHTTAAIMINENADPNILDDILDHMDKMIPLHNGYRHDAIDNNAAAHIKASIMGPSEQIPIRNGKLVLGTWQNIFFCEFDGPRKGRKVLITCIGSK